MPLTCNVTILPSTNHLEAFKKMGWLGRERTRHMDYSVFFASALAQLRDERRYRVFADLERIAGRFPHAFWHSPAGPRSSAGLGRKTLWPSSMRGGASKNCPATASATTATAAAQAPALALTSPLNM